MDSPAERRVRMAPRSPASTCDASAPTVGSASASGGIPVREGWDDGSKRGRMVASASGKGDWRRKQDFFGNHAAPQPIPMVV